ncbi:MAG: FapA family protein, partial [bacterium]
IENSTLTTKGNVLVKSGFVGTGEGYIIADGDVNVGYIHNQNIKSRANIVIAKEAIQSNLYARQSIKVYGKNISAVGGKLSARFEIELFTSGNESGTKTELEAGIDFALVEEKLKTEDKIKELLENRPKVHDNIIKLQTLKQRKKTLLPPKQESLLKKLLIIEQKINKQNEALLKRKKILENKLNEVGKARILIKSTIYPGTIIKIHDRIMTINEEIIGPKQILLIDDEIKIV